MPISRTHDPNGTAESSADSRTSRELPGDRHGARSGVGGGQADHFEGNGAQPARSGGNGGRPGGNGGEPSRSGERSRAPRNGQRPRPARNGNARTRQSPDKQAPEGPVFIEGQLPLEREAVLKAVAAGHAMGQAELAKHVSEALGVAPSTALGKIRGLEREGAIVGFRDGRRKGYLLPEPEPEPAPVLERAALPVSDTLVHELPVAPDEAAVASPGGPRMPRLRSLLSREGVPSPPRRSRIARAVPVVLVVLGTLLLAEGIVTVVWQEPFTSISAARSQDRLDGALGTAENRERRLSQARVGRLRDDQRKIDAFMAERATAINEKTPPGEALGRLKIDKIDLNLVMVQSTAKESLTKGPAHYTETVLPGRPGIVGIAGHRTTYSAPFRNINELKAGNEIVVTMPYGRFTYRVVGTIIVDAAFGGVFTAASFPGRQLPKKNAAGDGGKPAGAGDGGNQPEALSSDFGGLALTACHPLYSAAQRIIVYARLESTQPIGGTRRAATS